MEFLKGTKKITKLHQLLELQTVKMERIVGFSTVFHQI